MYDKTMRAFRIAAYQLTEAWAEAMRGNKSSELEAVKESGDKLLREIDDTLAEDELHPDDVLALTDLRDAILDDETAVEVRRVADRLEGVIG